MAVGAYLERSRADHEFDARAAASVSGGAKIADAARMLGCPVGRVYAALKRCGLGAPLSRLPGRDVVLAHYACTRSAMRTARETGRSYPLVLRWAREAGVLNPPGPVKSLFVDESFFSSYTPSSCYWAGFIAADGNVADARLTQHLSMTIEVHADDRGHLEQFHRAARVDYPIRLRERVRANGKICRTAQLKIYSERWCADLVRMFNITPRKSLTLAAPPVEMPDEMKWHFIRGYFDGDGTASGAPNNVGFVSGSYQFVCWLRRMFGGRYTIGTHGNVHQYRPCGKIMRAGVRLMYAGSSPETRLNRKHSILVSVGLLDPLAPLIAAGAVCHR